MVAKAKGKRIFTAASVNRLTGDWSSSSIAIDSELRRGLRVLRARSRDLVANNDYGQKFVGMVRSNVLGENGITCTVKAKDPDRVAAGKVVPGTPDVFANKMIGEAFWDWGKREYCTVTRTMSWAEVQHIGLETIAAAGECLIRIIPRAHRYGMSLQLLEPDLLDIEYNVPELAGGGEIRMGVEVDSFGAPVAYHMWTVNPDDVYGAGQARQKRVRIPADEIVHPFVTRRIGQTRGYPWMTASMFGINMLGGHFEAEMTKSRLVASKMAFLIRTGDEEYKGEESETGKYMDAEPGLIEELPKGLDIKAVDWNAPNQHFGDFTKVCLRRIAAGLGVSYNTFANDLESVNFSSSRVGLQDERATWKVLQAWFADHFCQPIFERFLEFSILSGAVPLPMTKFAKFNAAVWSGRRWEWVDPTKEVAAKISEMNAGLTSRPRILAELGIDPDELDEEILQDKEKREALGLHFSEVLLEPPPEPEEGEAPPKPKTESDRIIRLEPHIKVEVPPAHIEPHISIPPTHVHVDTNRSRRRVSHIRNDKGEVTHSEVEYLEEEKA